MNLLESVDRILSERTRLTDRFYPRFFERVPEARAHFAGIDLQVQSVMLTMALGAIREHPELKGACSSYLRVLGTRHKRIGIPRELYEGFLETLLECLAEFHGADWNETLASQWRGALTDAVQLMFDGYEDPYHV
jgi:hemoglobin-like flavoprotein